ncbi:MAG: hypothetical protein IJR40_06740, partial [Treponema sp.]|nr:hypothetical protein [Treponema sp.]
MQKMQDKKRAGKKSLPVGVAANGTARYRRYSQFAPCNYLRLPLARQGQIESFRQPPASFARFFARAFFHYQYGCSREPIASVNVAAYAASSVFGLAFSYSRRYPTLKSAKPWTFWTPADFKSQAHFSIVAP